MKVFRLTTTLGALLSFAVTAAVIGIAVEPAIAISFWGEETEPTPPAAEAEPAAPDQPAKEGTRAPIVTSLPDFATIADRVGPAVANISTTSQAAESQQMERPNPFDRQNPHEFWEPFERFFGPMPRRPFRERSLGSGFIINRDGFILTNNHVVENAEKIVVKLSDDKEYEAKVVGRDPKTDIAVIKIEGAKDLKPVPLGDSDALRVGEWVMAIGNPFGLEHTVTAGIVSAKGRFIGQGSYDQFIQTDVAINPGNSGGPLLNLRGEVVGINSAIFSRSGGNIGIGFAIPINLAKELLPELEEKGKVTRGWLGVMIQKVTPEIAESLGLTETRGALVADVMKDGPAREAGIEVGDVIVEFDGHTVKDSNELPMLVARTGVGKSVEVKILRNGKPQTMNVRIAELKEEGGEVASADRGDELGLAVQPLTPEIAESLGLEGETQ
ncbi:MAG TPA: DegQ family serine endoprotease, partial [Terriglobales bacterium]|nr:DegQ family serine endoprotease [Terriglobales bacterium]